MQSIHWLYVSLVFPLVSRCNYLLGPTLTEVWCPLCLILRLIYTCDNTLSNIILFKKTEIYSGEEEATHLMQQFMCWLHIPNLKLSKILQCIWKGQNHMSYSLLIESKFHIFHSMGKQRKTNCLTKKCTNWENTLPKQKLEKQDKINSFLVYNDITLSRPQ